MADRQGRDFFISYTGVNRPWAAWIAVQLEAAGHTTLLQAWDFRAEEDARRRLLAGVDQSGARPTSAPFPGRVGDLAGARAQYERALAISEAALGPDHPTVAALRDNLSGVLQAPQDATAQGPASAV